MMILGKFRQWLHDNLETRPARQLANRAQTVRLRLEALESREVPATFNVSTIDQLRAAIDQANSTAAADVINLKAGAIFDLDAGNASKNTLVGDSLFVAAAGGSLTVRSLGANAIIEHGGEGQDRIFVVEDGGKLALSKLTIRNGYADTDSDFGAQGGGILSFGTLSITSSTITDNYVVGDGSEGGPDNAVGGGVASYGALTITGSIISDNTAEAGPNFEDECVGYYAKGGGVAHFEGKLTITSTKFLDNEALGGFSGSEGDEAIGGFAAGGGLFAGDEYEAGDIPSISITSSVFQGNQAIGGGAEGIDADARGGDAFGGGAALGGPSGSKYSDPSTASITITGTTFVENVAQGGEGTVNWPIDFEEAQGGDASGGGLFFSVQANVALSKNAFTENEALGGAGTVEDGGEGFSSSDGGNAFGGGVAAGTVFDLEVGCCGDDEQLPFIGNLTITSNTFTENLAQGGLGSSGGEGDGGDALGGGLGVTGNGVTTITSSTFTDNTAQAGASEQDDDDFDFLYGDGGDAYGGGIFHYTTFTYGGEGYDPLPNALTIKNSTLQGNAALGGDADFELDEVFSGAEGYGGDAAGGALFAGAEGGSAVTITSTTFSDNTAQGGAVNVSGGEGSGGEGGTAIGGAVAVGGNYVPFFGTLAITSSKFDSNTAQGGAADIDPDFEFNDSFASGGDGIGGALYIGSIYYYDGVQSTVTGSTFTDNTAQGGDAFADGEGEAGGGDGIGGAIAHGGLSDNRPARIDEKGGSYYDSVLNITTTTISGNHALGGNADIEGTDASCRDEAYAGDGVGGGLFAGTEVQTIITRSTLDSNEAVGGNATGDDEADRLYAGDGIGGGLALGSEVDPCYYSGGEGYDYQLVVVNSTFAYNDAIGGDAEDDANKKSRGGDGVGGGLFIQAGSYSRLVNNTIAYNEASGGEGDDCDGEGLGGGLYSGDECECGDKGENLVNGGYGYGIEMLNTLIALNSADFGTDVYGSVLSEGCNLIGDATDSCGFNTDLGDLLGDDINPIDPKLGLLANNGGPTRTIALLKGSPAINRGNNSVLTNAQGPVPKLTVDQRGHMRKAGPRVDIGAYEYGSPVLGRGQP